MLIGETEAREDRRWAVRAGKFLWELTQTVALTLLIFLAMLCTICGVPGSSFVSWSISKDGAS